MKQCSKCGLEKPLDAFPRSSSGKDGRHSQCSECRREAKRVWADQNRERIKTYNAQYWHSVAKDHSAERYAKHRAMYIAYNRAAYAANPLKHQALRQRWREAHRDDLHAYDRRRYYSQRQAMLDRNKAWHQAHPYSSREYGARRRVRLVGGRIESVNYHAIVERDQNRCHICGRAVTPSELSFDHVIPISQGGPHEASNIRVAHRSCNSRKGNRIQL